MPETNKPWRAIGINHEYDRYEGDSPELVARKFFADHPNYKEVTVRRGANKKKMISKVRKELKEALATLFYDYMFSSGRDPDNPIEEHMSDLEIGLSEDLGTSFGWGELTSKQPAKDLQAISEGFATKFLGYLESIDVEIPPVLPVPGKEQDLAAWETVVVYNSKQIRSV